MAGRIGDWLRGRLAGRENEPGASAAEQAELASPEYRQAAALIASHLQQAARVDYNLYYVPGKMATGRAILEADPRLRIACLYLLLARLPVRGPGASDNGWYESLAVAPLAQRLLTAKLPYSPADLERVFAVLARVLSNPCNRLSLQGFLKNVQAMTPGGMTPGSWAALDELRQVWGGRAGNGAERKVLRLMDDMLGRGPAEGFAVEEDDDWGYQAAPLLAQMPAADRELWSALLAHCAGADGEKPSRAWQAGAKERIGAYGEERFRQTACSWFDLLQTRPRRLVQLPFGEPEVPDEVGLAEQNAGLLKGLAWCCGLLERGDEQMARTLADAAEESYRKVTGLGARAGKVGSACIWALAQMPGMAGVVQLERLRHRLKYVYGLRQVDKALQESAARQSLTRDELDDLAVPDFGLVDGRLRRAFDAYTAEVEILAAGEVVLRWLRPDGKAQAGVPAAVKRDHAEELKALKQTMADMRTALAVQRHRLENLLRSDRRRWSLADWRLRYLDHPLLSYLTRRLVWAFDCGGTTLGAWYGGQMVNLQGQALMWPDPGATVRLWHPIASDAETIHAWQLWLEEHRVTQPFKQAHREIYRLTDAEQGTATYSNRFAAHILRNHQLQAICRERGWRYRVIPSFETPPDAYLDVDEWDLRVELAVEPVGFEQGLESDAMVPLYVITGQVRIQPLRGEVREPLALTDVSPLAFSEGMRDIDLFVSVCTVGNDPEWRDHGPLAYAGYWTRYAFGELLSSGQDRRELLQRLLPGLAIADRCSLTERFLIVRGDRRTYKIHLGSANILMEPDNQYLCIVSRPAERAGDRLYLPFEGDQILSLILSKAFLLAGDRAIQDPTILRQIRG